MRIITRCHFSPSAALIWIELVFVLSKLYSTEFLPQEVQHHLEQLHAAACQQQHQVLKYQYSQRLIDKVVRVPVLLVFRF